MSRRSPLRSPPFVCAWTVATVTPVVTSSTANLGISAATLTIAGFGFSTTAGSAMIGSVNWQTLPSQGVAVYTNAWGSRSHPAGSRVVVVAGTKVTKILTGTAATVVRSTTFSGNSARINIYRVVNTPNLYFLSFVL